MSVATLSVTTITVSRPTITVDSFGGQLRKWATVLTTKARVQPLSGADRVRHERLEEIITHKVYVSGTPDIRDQDRITAGSLTLYVRSVRDIDLVGSFLTIECEQRDD